MLDKKLRQRRASELAASTFSSRSTTDGVLLVNMGVTEGVSLVDPTGLGLPDPPSS